MTVDWFAVGLGVIALPTAAYLFYSAFRVGMDDTIDPPLCLYAGSVTLLLGLLMLMEGTK